MSVDKSSPSDAPPHCPGPSTAYPETEAALAKSAAAAGLNRAAFARPLARCDLAQCKGMCCYDGVYVSNETAVRLQQVADAQRPVFSAMGLDLPDQVVVQGQWHGEVAGRKTAVKPWPGHADVADYPAHFTATACVFHLDDGRCGLQLLAVQEGRHPWHYKPLTCWMHPIDVVHGVVTLHDESNDPYRYPDYDGYVCRTHCGRTVPGGEPALSVLHEELAFLARLMGRDLLAPGDEPPK